MRDKIKSSSWSVNVRFRRFFSSGQSTFLLDAGFSTQYPRLMARLKIPESIANSRRTELGLRGPLSRFDGCVRRWSRYFSIIFGSISQNRLPLKYSAMTGAYVLWKGHDFKLAFTHLRYSLVWVSSIHTKSEKFAWPSLRPYLLLKTSDRAAASAIKASFLLVAAGIAPR